MNDKDEGQGMAQIPDETVEAWLIEAKRGDKNALSKLRRWAYNCAQRYFKIRASRERFVTEQDVQEMASGFFLEFDAAWPRIRSATRFTRYLLANGVARYLKKKRVRQNRETDCDPDQIPVDPESDRPWRTWDDVAWARYQAVLRTFDEADDQTRAVVVGRLSTPPRPYRELSIELQSTETSLRMRMTRFYRRVRWAYEEIDLDGLPPMRELPRLEDVIRDAQQDEESE